ncbi:MAG: DegT/DnrJ/EryC1/StrS family aminotransferase, partial [Candidatus Krumholzibacteriota bacterium]|nr:DegT/DnrJ/EryC1/StrS family aminotransferase [Candidatus Krumholzibacteriota bacterium]
AVAAAITPRTKAIVPVHLYGQPADMDAIREIAAANSVKVIADAAQAHGADIEGDRKRILGDCTTFSFYPGKNLGAYGDAGMVVTDDGEVADLMRALGDHGSNRKYHHFAEGWNYRLDGIQAAVLDVKLQYIEEWTERRRSRAARYDSLFADSSVSPIGAVQGRRHVYHLYVVRMSDRDAAMAKLRERGIACGIHYPVPLHLQPAYDYLGKGVGSFPAAEKVTAEIVSLPMFPELSDAAVDEVAAAVIEING